MIDAEVAIAAAEAGATVVRRLFGTALRRIDKGTYDFATHADVEAEQAILGVLRRERPRDVVLAEESGRNDPGAGDAGRTWLVDPLCGTRNYAAGTRAVAVNVALVVGDRLDVAAVADPFGSEVLWTDGLAAFSRSDGRDAPLTPDPRSRLVELNLEPPAPQYRTFRSAMLAADPGFARAFHPRATSSTIALAWVATGQRAAYVTDGDLRHNVHFAAGIALCAAAGCAMSDLRGRAFGIGGPGLVVAADAATHAAVLSLLGAVLG